MLIPMLRNKLKKYCTQEKKKIIDDNNFYQKI